MPHEVRSSPDGRNDPLRAWIRAANEVTDVLASARGLSEAASDLLRGVGEWLGCDSAALWVHQPSRKVLDCLRAWSREAHPAGLPEGVQRPVTIEHGTGLVGRAWALRRPMWSQDVSAAPGIPSGAVAIPILYGDAFYGVLELWGREPLPSSEEHRIAAGQVGKQIGQFVARETALRELLRSRRELADLFENAPVGVHLLDREGRILRANRAELDMLGYSRDEYVGRLWREFHVDPGAADAMLRRLASDEAGEEVRRAEVELRAKDGSAKWVRIEANALRDESGFTHVRAFMRDVTAGKEAEIALKASDERYRRLVEGARDYALHPLDPEGRVTGWNSGAQRLFGYEQ